MAVYDVRGRLVRVLLDRPEEPGRGSMMWDGRDGEGRTVASGAYFVRLEAGGETRTRRVVVAR